MSRRPETRADVQPARDRRGGFTLVETLVAFIVLATILSVLFRGVVGLQTGALTFETRAHAALVARTILEDTLPQRLPQTGSIEGQRDGRTWTMRMTAIDLAAQLPPAPANPDQKDKAVLWAPERVVIHVDTGGRPVEVETIRLVKVR